MYNKTVLFVSMDGEVNRIPTSVNNFLPHRNQSAEREFDTVQLVCIKVLVFYDRYKENLKQALLH